MGIKKIDISGFPARGSLQRLAALALVLMAGFLAGCAVLPDAEEKPVGIGRGTDDYKKSPCACSRIEQLPPPAWAPRPTRGVSS